MYHSMLRYAVSQLEPQSNRRRSIPQGEMAHQNQASCCNIQGMTHMNISAIAGINFLHFQVCIGHL